ncbi:uncharacterized protein K489DRAFT_155990 [Dissoconium aciculare CBS 342.82]|uniref:Uncharacterized protein n=1 Tax=Dissoconium aciculare CBS 342.82 TaxID=1314786 RepID=A0A6J3MBV4_9PEZI|nr:uncharacterized protein K489DRAFT_155990 [Dissoconium aciculare CBS 342.82]KAF1825363.1 hypothetical protein K489DRAFT_155990 [Dissoconium aciculare CBS 342.82]
MTPTTWEGRRRGCRKMDKPAVTGRDHGRFSTALARCDSAVFHPITTTQTQTRLFFFPSEMPAHATMRTTRATCEDFLAPGSGTHSQASNSTKEQRDGAGGSTAGRADGRMDRDRQTGRPREEGTGAFIRPWCGSPIAGLVPIGLVLTEMPIVCDGE